MELFSIRIQRTFQLVSTISDIIVNFIGLFVQIFTHFKSINSGLYLELGIYDRRISG